MADFDIANKAHRYLIAGIAVIFAGAFAVQLGVGLILGYALAFSGIFLCVLACLEVGDDE